MGYLQITINQLAALDPYTQRADILTRTGTWRRAMPSINGFTCGSSARAIGVKSYKVPGTQVSLPVRSEVAPLLIGFAAEFHVTVEPLVRGWNWGYAYRNVRGASNPSFHAAGVAIDLNAPRHPLGRRGTFTPRQAAQIRALCKKYGLRWGGDYRVRKDEMHVEVILPRAQALARVQALRGGGGASRTRPPVRPPATSGYPARLARHVTGSRVLRVGMKGTDVWDVQNALRTIMGPVLVKDGDYGPATARVVKRYQAIRKIGIDGKVGPKTLATLRTDMKTIAARSKK